MKWVFILIAIVLSLLVIFGQGEAHEQGQTLTYTIHLDEGEERRDIDFGVISSSSTTSSSTTLTSPPTTAGGTTTTDPTVPSSGTSTTDPSVTVTTSPTPLVTTTSTTTTPTPTTGTVPTLRNRSVLVGALVALLSYWLWRRRPRE